MVAIPESRIAELGASLNVSTYLMRGMSEYELDDYIRTQLANQLVKQIMNEDLITIRSSFEEDPLADKTFQTKLRIIQE